MSIPRDHHYLPQFYLDRWARNGEVIRYVRRGPEGKLDCRPKTPKWVAYERDLYRLEDVEDPRESQALEMSLFQLIDDRAATAFQRLPDRLVILAHSEEVVRSFSSQPTDVLVAGINQAVVEQAKDIVIAADKNASRMVDRLFLRPQPDQIFDTIGTIRRRAPLVDMRAAARQIIADNGSATCSI